MTNLKSGLYGVNLLGTGFYFTNGRVRIERKTLTDLERAIAFYGYSLEDANRKDYNERRA